MIKNYLKTAFRNLKRYKAFTFINVIGFSVGLSTCLIIYLFIQHETSFDKHLTSLNQLYRIVTKETTSKGVEYYESVPYPLGEALRTELLKNNQVVSIYFDSKQLKVNNQIFRETGLVYTDSVFCSMFDVDFLQGEPTVLNEPGSVLLTQHLAKKFFGENSPMGKKIRISDYQELTIKGIIADPPKNTHIPYRLLISSHSLTGGHINFDYDKWGSNTSHVATYLKLPDPENIKHTEGQINKIYQSHYEGMESQKVEYFLQKVKDIHTDGRFGSFSGTYVISKKLIWIFISIGVIILALALFNFINLSTVQAIRRTKEIGLRKVVGASRKKLILQMLGETSVVVFISVIVALIMTEILMPFLNHFTGNLLSLSLYSEKSVILFIGIILIVVSLMAGLFPAFFMSRYQPIEAIRSKLAVNKKKTLPVHRVLVILQFFIAQTLIIGVITINKQLHYLNNKDLGFNKERLLVVGLPHANNATQQTFKTRLSKIPEVTSSSFSMGEPLSGSNNVSSYQVKGLDRNYFANIKAVDGHFLETYDIRLKTGRWFREDPSTEESKEVVVNEKMVRDIGFSDPASAIGQFIQLFGKTRQIVGVADNFHVYPLKKELFPLIFYYNTHLYGKAGIKVSTENYQEVIPRVKKAFNDVFPETLFNYYIYEDYLSDKYKGESKFLNLLKVFTLVAVILASMGLVGLVSFLMVQKTKDIGIRKALGSFATGIVLLYTSRYLKIIALSSIISWPVAYFLLSNWLQNYAYHVRLSVEYFFLGMVIILSISLVSILYNTIRVAHTNPVDSLKYE